MDQEPDLDSEGSLDQLDEPDESTCSQQDARHGLDSQVSEHPPWSLSLEE